VTAPGDTDLARDFEDLLSMHAAVQADATRYRALFDAAPVALVITDRSLRVTDANAAAFQLLEVPDPYLLSKPLSVFVDLESRRLLRQSSQHFRERPQTLSLRMRRRTGVAFDALARVTPGPNELYWSITDRTDEAQAEARLWELNRELERRVDAGAAELRTLVAQLPVGVLVVDSAGSIEWSNARADAIFAGSPRAVSQLAAGAPIRTTVVRADGTDIVVDVIAAPLDDGAGRTVVVVEDVTQRAQLERADAEFVENAAHQLRTPITAIGGSVGALVAGASDDPEERDRFLGHIARETDRMGRLVDSLLTLAGYQRGAGRPVVELVPLRRLVESSAVRLSPGPRLVVKVADDIAVVGDRELFAHAIENVVSNALAHASSEVRIEAELTGSTVLLDVADDGPGIAPEARERIFERFFRMAPDGRKGSGLGLAIARAAAHATRSTLDVAETAGAGATFRFRMPGARLL
jgi:signal transduction histidine kinase